MESRFRSSRNLDSRERLSGAKTGRLGNQLEQDVLNRQRAFSRCHTATGVADPRTGIRIPERQIRLNHPADERPREDR